MIKFSRRFAIGFRKQKTETRGYKAPSDSWWALNKLRMGHVANKHDGELPFNQSKTNMKQTTLVKLLAAGTAGAVALSTAFAQETSTTTTTTGGTTGVSESTTSTSTLNGSGTITAYTPGSDYIMFRTESSTTPVRYYYTKKTVLVDPEGRTVEWSALKPDMPVTYTYTKEGDRMVVTKVTLAKTFLDCQSITLSGGCLISS